MQQKASSFNKGIYFFNLRRFWLISFSFAFLLSLNILDFLRYASERVHRNSAIAGELASDIFVFTDITATVMFSAFSLIAALAVFSYIHKQDSTAMLHALPLTRKCLFITNYLSGLTLVMLPLLVGGAILIAGELLSGITEIGYSFLWMAVSSVFLFLWYSFAVFAGMFTGHMAAHALFFLIFNFLAVFLQDVIGTLLSSLVFGYARPYQSPFTPLSPIVYLVDVFLDLENGKGNYAVLACYLIAGIVFTLGAGAVYIRRRMESAGDVVSVRVMRPVFKYSVAFCSAGLLGSIVVDTMNFGRSFSVFLTSYLLGGFIGYFAAEMLLRKTVRVFRNIKGFLAFALIIVLFLSAVNFDLFGYEDYVPDAEDVEVMYVGYYMDDYAKIALNPENYNPERHRYLFDDSDYVDNPPSGLDESLIRQFRQRPGVLEEPESIRKATELHRAIVQNARLYKRLDRRSSSYYDDSDDTVYTNLTFTYRMKNGKTTERAYYIPIDAPGGEPERALRELVTTGEFRKKLYSMLEVEAGDISLVNVILNDEGGTVVSLTDKNDIEEFLDALKKDIANTDPVDMFLNHRKDSFTGISATFYFREGRAPAVYDRGMFYLTGNERRVLIWSDYSNTIGYLAEKTGLVR